MRLVFFGSGEFGLPTFGALADAHDVALTVTQPDRPAGRARRLTATSIGQWAHQHDLPVLKAQKVNDPGVVETVLRVGADANIVVAFGQKIGADLIDSPRHGSVATMNLHASLLPKYRGAAPVNWAIIRGETETGNTLFSLVDRMDAGDILAQQTTPIDPMETAGQLHDRLAAMGPQLVLDVLSQLEAGTLQPQPQDELQMSIAPKLTKAEGRVELAASADHVRRIIHGLTPWPGVACRWCTDVDDEGIALKLLRAESLTDHEHNQPPGTLIGDGLIACGSGAVRLLEVQPAGKRAMQWDQFARGHRAEPGMILRDEAG